MGNICCLLDACTVISLIYIDSDGSLLKRMKKVEIKINDFVFSEIKDNVYINLNSQFNSKYINRNALDNFRKEIDQRLTFFRSLKNDNEELLRDVGDDYFDRISCYTAYSKKRNGELCSAAYALYLSRVFEKKVFFYTEDYPARMFFSRFFNFQQIGHIKDTVDFLILLYWLDESFSRRMLENYLSELYSHKILPVVGFKQVLREFQSTKVDGRFARENRSLVGNIKELVIKLDNLDFRSINGHLDYFKSVRKKHGVFFNSIEKFFPIFELEVGGDSPSLLEKITHVNDEIKKNQIFKWKDIFPA
ncbi:hypothetical protein J0A68_20900 [Algoriphagus sp. H41]|uniref:DUF4435 domain-containing protein n=1 Tax=Algoriphagus oliviformis TaxID=2811231 RepID=A0ABS3C8J6_9BACT|nr:hypothetical protein [Algoriphagus oliviformis]MBN7813427.1 hypothetical protein [Algoriphagus oliviformis]